jgi:hypothetical protein
MLPNKLLHLNEATIGDIKRKQGSITRLFPTFPDRVRNVQKNGGVKTSAYLTAMDPDVWRFKIASGTSVGKTYQILVKFLNMKGWIKLAVGDKRYWKPGTTNVDLTKLANLILNKADVKLVCSCPAFQYWGPAYILSLAKYKAKYGDQERRPPRIRNPRQYGAVCKHTHLLLKELPEMTKKFVDFLEGYYLDDIESMKKKGVQKTLQKKVADRDKEAKRSIVKWQAAKKKKEEMGEAKKYDDWTDRVIQYFGTTDDWNKAGFLTAKGELINLSKIGRDRAYAHEVVGEFAYDDLKKSVRFRSDLIENFLELGNIRLDAEHPFIDLVKEPTKEQYSKLEQYLDYIGDRWDIIDLSTKDNYFEAFPKENVIKFLKDYFCGRIGTSPSDLAKYHNVEETTTGDAIAFQPSHFGAPVKGNFNYLRTKRSKRKVKPIHVKYPD